MNVFTLVGFAVGGILGFIFGALVYRNNAKLFEEKYARAQAEIALLKEKLGVK